jgi:hypothetical protein
MPRLVARALRVLLWTFALLILLWAAVIKAPMALTRWRMQHLLADFHSIYPTQSTWSDAQRIIANWHHWGYAKGPCTATDCDYTIDVSDPIGRRVQKWWPENLRGLTWSYALKALYAQGWRDTDFQLKFVVQDGKIVRTQTRLDTDVVDSWIEPYNWDYGLILVSQVRSRLRRPEAKESRSNEPWILGSDKQLDDHPDYKLGRPGGCETCERVDLTYTSTLQHSALVSLTAYDLSCLTRLRPCTQIYDLLPAARDWHFYDGDYMGPKLSGGPGPIPCRTEPRARARDAELILEVEPISVQRHIDTEAFGSPTVELTKARLLRVIKGAPNAQLGSTITILPFSGLPAIYRNPAELPEHLTPGRQFLVIVDMADQFVVPNRFGADRCGLLDDTPANLAALEAGIAQDITVRHPITY